MSEDLHQYENWPIPSIETHTGIEFFPLDPRVEDVNALDIVHALSLKCRYTGHSAFFFSVAQHSALMCDFVQMTGGSYVDQKWALMHDASEAYLPDVAGPIKHLISGFIEAEDRLLRVIASKFGLPWPKSENVAKIDRLMYWHERDHLLKPVKWLNDDIRLEVPPLMRNRITIGHWTPQQAEQEWWDRFCRLFVEMKGVWSEWR